MKTRFLFIALPLIILSGCLSSGSQQQGTSSSTPKPQATTTIQLTADESDEYVTALAFKDSTLWIGTENAVYSWLEDQTDTPQVKKHNGAVNNSKVNSINLHNDAVIVASYEGYSRYERENWTKFPIGNSNEIIPVGNELWSATNSGIEVLKPNSLDWAPLEVSSATDYSPTRQMQAIGSDGTSTLWVGTQFGLHRFDLGGYLEFMQKLNSGNIEPGKIDNSHFWKRYYGNYQSPMGGMIANESGNCPLIGNNVERIVFDSEKQRFLFCTKKGLSILQGGNWKSYSGTSRHLVSGTNGQMDSEERTGNIDIPTSEVYDVISRNDTLYIATRSGLGIIDESSGKTTLLTLSEGLPSNEVTSLALNPVKKNLYIGTASGVAILKLHK